MACSCHGRHYWLHGGGCGFANLVRRISLTMAMQRTVPVRLEERDGLESQGDVAPLRAAVYPPEVLATIVWRRVVSAHATRRILVYDDAALVAAAGMHFREARVDGVATNIAGIGGVMTLPSAQRRGFGRAAMLAAQESIEHGKRSAFGLLFCELKNIGFYQPMGWRVFNGTVIVEQPGAVGPYQVMPTLVRSLASAAPAEGTIDLCGLPW
jgi:GNAT superfamily N-acetyltransferase